MKKPAPKTASAGEYVYSAYITLRNGRRLYAAHYGLKAFCFKRRK